MWRKKHILDFLIIRYHQLLNQTKKTDTKLKIFITLQLNNTDHRHSMNVVTTVRLTQRKREKASRVKNSSSCNLIKFSFRISPYIHTYIHTYNLFDSIYLPSEIFIQFLIMIKRSFLSSFLRV